MDKEIRCKGCGEILQSTDKNSLGYVPDPLMVKEDSLCQRCFRLKNYGEFKSVEISDDSFKAMFDDIRKKDGLILFVLDAFNIDGSINSEIIKLSKDIKTIIVVNKIDIMPKSLKSNSIISYIKEKTKRVDCEKMMLVSSKKKENIDELINNIIKTRKKNIYVVGNNNTGKSSLINAISKAINKDNEPIRVTSFYPGTTLNIIKEQLKDFAIYDTPGLMNTCNIYELLNTKNLKKVINENEIKPISMTIYPNTSLYIGSIARIDFNIPSKANIILYGSNLIRYQKSSKNDKLEALEKDSLYVPKLSKKEEYNKTNYELKGERTSINLWGLCTIDILRSLGNINIYKPSKLNTSISKSIYGGHHATVNNKTN